MRKNVKREAEDIKVENDFSNRIDAGQSIENHYNLKQTVDPIIPYEAY